MLEVKDLSFAYPDGPVFTDLSFVLQDFSIAALLGGNGAGKTTLLKLLLGLLKADQGQILLDGTDLGKLKEKERSFLLSYVPQEMDDSLTMDVLDFITLASYNRHDLFGGADEEDKKKAQTILLELQIPELSSKRMDALSSGQRRLIYLARAIFQDSALMCLDEPVSSLDLLRQHLFLQHLKDHVTKNNKQVIMSIHDPALAYAYADTFLFIKEHKLYDIVSLKEKDARERLQKDIAILYDNKVTASFRKGQLFLEYADKN